MSGILEGERKERLRCTQLILFTADEGSLVDGYVSGGGGCTSANDILKD